MIRTDQLIEFWQSVPHSPPFLHPEDATVLRKLGTNLDDYGVDLNLFPQPWVGPIKTARGFVLQLNPGLSGPERKVEATNRDFRQALRNNLRGELENLFLPERFSSHPGHGWVERHLKGVAPLARLAANVAQVELFPYHSATFKIPSRILLALPSVELISQWANKVLIPAAQCRKVVVVVQRSSGLWGLSAFAESDSLVIYRGAECQGGWITSRSRGGKALMRLLTD